MSHSSPIPPAHAPLMESFTENTDASAASAEASAPREPFTGWKDVTARLLGDSEGKWKDTATQLSAYVRENPGKTILSGIVTGLVVGLLFPGRTQTRP